MYFKDHMLFLQKKKKQCFFCKKTWQKKHMIFVVDKAKRKVLFCECFFKKKKYDSAKSLFCWERVSPAPPGYGPGFISVNFGNIVDH